MKASPASASAFPRIRRAGFLLLMAWTVGVVFARVGLPLLEPEEARYAEIPREMLVEDSWLVPVHGGQPYLDKPPLLYWLVQVSYCALGAHDWSARLVTAAAAALTVAALCWWGWRTQGPSAGLAGAAVLALTGDFLYRGPMLTMNGLLALFVTVGLAAGHVALLGGALRLRWWLVSALACAAGVLTKGPVAIVLVGGPLLLFPLCDRTLARPGLLAWVGYLAAVVAVAGPWFVALAVRVPGFVDYFWWKHHVERFTDPFDHAEPAWFYLPRLALGTFPWSLALGALAVRSFRATAGQRVPPPLTRAALTATAVGLLFFSLAGSKRPVYAVPLEPPLALAVGAWVAAWFESGPSRVAVRLWGVTTATTAGLLLAGVLFWLPAYTGRFSVRAIVRAATTEAADPARPVYCYGRHEGDSVRFYLGRNDVQDFAPDRRAELYAVLARKTPAVLFVPGDPSGEEVIRGLPQGLHFTLLSRNRLLAVGVVSAGADARPRPEGNAPGNP
jgi:4-amino-4-deoxy-L-arabinose transferase-like glycosyltransferase